MFDGNRVVASEQLYAFAFMHTSTRSCIKAVVFIYEFSLLLAANVQNKYISKLLYVGHL